MRKIPVGVSQCLLGDPVRYNGGHKHSPYLTDVLERYLEFRPACPEVAIGLGVPREPVHLVGEKGTRVKGTQDQQLDITEALLREAQCTAERMGDICGYIFMQDSPSCGLFGVKRYTKEGALLDSRGQGAYAARLRQLLPLVPMEEAGRLDEPTLCENFITRVFAYWDWRVSLGADPAARDLVTFYSRYKYQVMAHHPASYQIIGRLLADFGGKDPAEVNREFIRLLMAALARPAGREGNTNAMLHMLGYLKKQLAADKKAELLELIDSYRRGERSLTEPLNVLKYQLDQVGIAYLQRQSFWSPYPDALALR